MIHRRFERRCSQTKRILGIMLSLLLVSNSLITAYASDDADIYDEEEQVTAEYEEPIEEVTEDSEADREKDKNEEAEETEDEEPSYGNANVCVYVVGEDSEAMQELLNVDSSGLNYQLDFDTKYDHV